MQTLDAAGQETFDPPAFVKFTGVSSHFSTWAVAVVTPCTLNYSIAPSIVQVTGAGGTGTVGPDTAANVVIADALPAGTTFVRTVSAPIGCTSDGTSLSCFPPTAGTPCSLSGAVVSCDVGTLAPVGPGHWIGAGMLLEVRVTAPPGTTLVNVATVGATTPDPAPGNNANGATTRVLR
ncbi:MAG: hypothetical protein AB7H93_12685 [Vicinamibacterales bacterium]